MTIAIALNRVPAASTITSPKTAPSGEPPSPARGTAEPTPGEPEAREQGRGGQGDEPRVGGLERREERLRAATDELGDEAGDRRDQEQDGGEGQPGGGRERAVATGDGRPRHGRDRDQDRPGGREPDQQVHGPARPVAEEHEAERGEPQHHQHRGKDSELDRPHTHVAESTHAQAAKYPATPD